MKKWLTSRTSLIIGLLALGTTFGVGVYFALTGNAAPRGASYDEIPFNGERSYGHLKAICALGPRVSGTPAMTAQQKMITDHFTALGAKVIRQEFQVRHPETGEPVNMANLIVQWHADRRQRILLCAHYDTRPFPDRDTTNPRGVFLGANDGASGVALLMELGRSMPDLRSPYGVDFVFFDCEEFIFRENPDGYFIGSDYFAADYVKSPPEHRYVAGVLLDMVADASLQLYWERNSLAYAPAVCRDMWDVARSIGVKEFIHRPRHTVRDDHLGLNRVAKIPTIDIIDFDYPRPGKNYWHTTADTPENCSADSLEKVGKVVHEWLRRLK